MIDIEKLGGLLLILAHVALAFLFHSTRRKSKSRAQPGSEDAAYELLESGTELELCGRVQDALTTYRVIVEKYSHTPAAHDAERSIDSLIERTAA